MTVQQTDHEATRRELKQALETKRERPRHERDQWRVVLETRDPRGTPYHNIYRYVYGDSREEVIDYCLEHLVGLRGGMRSLADGWQVVSAWAVLEEHVGDDIGIRPIDQPVFRRA